METTLRGLSKVRVSKSFLLEKLQANRIEHEKSYYEILEARQKKMLEDLGGLTLIFEKELNERIEKASADIEYMPPSIMMGVSAPKPENHTRDYDKVISLLAASLDDEFELSSSEFDQYVNDDWSWKQSFLTCSGTYMPLNLDKLK